MAEINYADIAKDIAETLLGYPNPRHSSGGDYRYGQKGSLSVDIATGTFFDHENNIGGGMLDLIKRQNNASDSEAIEWLKENGLISPVDATGANSTHHKTNSTHHATSKPPIGDDKRHEAIQIWNRTVEADTHPYLSRKGIYHYDVARQDPATSDLVVPIFSAARQLQSIERISTGGDKKSLGSKKGGLCIIDGGGGGWLTQEHDVILIAEGFATAATLYQESGKPTAITFGAGGVRQTAELLRQQCPSATLLFCGDADEASRKAAASIENLGITAIYPQAEGADFNDIATLESEDIAAAINAALVAAEPLKTIPVIDVMTAYLEPLRFVFDPIAPRGVVTLLGAHGGVGKSYLALTLAVCAVTGRPFAGMVTAQQRVLYYSAEDPAEVMRWRLKKVCQALGIDAAALGGLCMIDATETDPTLYREVVFEGQRSGTETATYSHLSQRVKRHGATLVIVDNASDVYDANENERARVRQFMRLMTRLATDNSAAVMLLCHLDKATAKHGSKEAYSGSTAWHNSARSRLFLFEDLDGALTLEHQKSNHARKAEPIYLQRTQHGALIEASTNPADGEAAQSVSRQDNEDISTVINLLRLAAADGAHVPTATGGNSTAHEKLAHYPEYDPFKCRTITATKQRVFRALLNAHRRGRIVKEIVTQRGRKPVECWQLPPTVDNSENASNIS